ncbi:hypothetical protein [Oerskovia jenensis]|uniref:hypothetical protein n=1 Tax=Oerskovia jenensis TaxID=162169 RepID=UPI0036DBF30D
MSELAEFFVHEVVLAPIVGSGGYGDVHGPPVPVRCLVDGRTQLVRDRAGAEVVSSTSVFAGPEAPDGPPGSLVTLPSGRIATVITQARRTSGPLGLPDHVEWALT